MVQLAFKWLAAFWLMPWRILSRWVTAFRNSLRQVFGLEPSVDVQRDKDGGAVERAQAPDRNEVRTRVPSHAGSFLQAYYLGYAGIRNYKVFIPPGYNKQPLPLVVMLHGCTQAPEDFALGTGMNALAATHQFFVVYPEQALLANGLKCWNWFKSSNQHRDRGEPAIIAGITQEVIKTYGLDATRVYVAGLSAGGAMAVIMGRAYPDLYAAVGVHSGIPYAAAHNANSAFAVMKGAVSRSRRTTLAPRLIPTIVLHGDNDKTVHHAGP